MSTFEFLFQGILVAMQPMNLLYAFVGVTLGTAVGVLPGIGPALTVALLLPVTYKLDPAGSLIMFAGIYYGGMYGGSTTSILLNTPGESASIVTALEGNKMARAGPRRAGAGDGCDRLVRRRPDRDARTCLHRALHRQAGAGLRAARVFRADGARLRHGLLGLRRFGVARADLAVHRLLRSPWSASTSRRGRRGFPSAFPTCSTASR
jgi:hypothetical protein